MSRQFVTVCVREVPCRFVQVTVLCNFRALNVPAGTVTDSASTTLPVCSYVTGDSESQANV